MHFFFFLSHVFSATVVKKNPFTDVDYPVVQNQGWTKYLNKSFHRLPNYAKDKVRTGVWQRSLESSGLALFFKTDSSNFDITLTVNGEMEFLHIPNTGVAGFDIYARVPNTNNWSNTFNSFEFNKNAHTARLKFGNTFSGVYEYRMYLPSFVEITKFDFAVYEGTFEWLPKDETPPIIIYGTSIVQGAVSYRPQQMVTNLLQQQINMPVINLGFALNGKLDTEVIELMIENEASVYVLDCLPDLGGFSKQTVKRMLKNAVSIIRKTRKTIPVILVDHLGFANEDMNAYNKAEVTKMNEANKETYDELYASDKNVYRITKEEIGMDIDSWADVIHTSTIGAHKLADAYERKVREILKK